MKRKTDKQKQKTKNPELADFKKDETELSEI